MEITRPSTNKSVVACRDRQAHEARKLLSSLGVPERRMHLIMDRALGGDERRQLAFDPGFIPAAPLKSNRVTAWHCSTAIYRRRNESERLFAFLKGFRRRLSRNERLDVMFAALILSP